MSATGERDQAMCEEATAIFAAVERREGYRPEPAVIVRTLRGLADWLGAYAPETAVYQVHVAQRVLREATDELDAAMWK